MKVRIAMPGACAVADLTCEDAVKAFRKMNEILLGIGMKAIEQAEIKAEVPVPEVHIPEAHVSKTVDPEPAEWMDPSEQLVQFAGQQDDNQAVKISVKGFLYIRCPKCGTERGFCTSDPITETTCRICGHEISYSEPLRLVWLHCECGARYHYMTNIQDHMFEINCLSCKRSVAVEWNKKKNLYGTIQ